MGSSRLGSIQGSRPQASHVGPTGALPYVVGGNLEWGECVDLRAGHLSLILVPPLPRSVVLSLFYSASLGLSFPICEMGANNTWVTCHEAMNGSGYTESQHTVPLG